MLINKSEYFINGVNLSKIKPFFNIKIKNVTIISSFLKTARIKKDNKR